MRFKPVPAPPADLETVAAARDAVPMVPAGETDCCARVVDRIDVERDAAREWLTFLRALELARETDHGFVRTDAPVNRAALAAAFRERVFGAREVLDALDAEPRSPAAVAGDTYAVVPEWERDRRPNPRAEWGERVERLLGWAALLGLADATDEGFSRGGR